MVNLYKTDGDVMHYWETWDVDQRTGMIHWGIIGHKGESKEVKSKLFSSFKNAIDKEIRQKLNEGYHEVDLEDHYTLLIEYSVDGMGTADDVDKRTRLQDKMDQVLGWTGLGHCDGGSIGSGTMEVCCFVIDFDTAKSVIEKALLDSEFSNYIRIFDENDL